MGTQRRSIRRRRSPSSARSSACSSPRACASLGSRSSATCIDAGFSTRGDEFAGEANRRRPRRPTRRRRDAPRRLWNKRSPRSAGAATNAAEKRTEGDRGDPSDATAAASATSDLCIINLLSIGIYLARRASSIAANVASYAARPSSSRVSVSASHTFWSACFKICPPHS